MSLRERPVVMDVDDLCDAVMVQEWRGQRIDLVEWLASWHAREEGLKLTAFTIPRRTSDATIRRFKDELPWVALAPHGHAHCRGECLGWTRQEALDKLRMARERGIDAPIFRAPGWLIEREVYEAAGELGYTIASHADMRCEVAGVKEYVYNLHVGANPMRTKRIHGHFTPVAGNMLYDMAYDGRLKVPHGATYVWPWEVAVVGGSTT